MIRKIKRVLYYLIIIGLIVIVGFLFFSIIPNSPVKSFVVLSGSMEPAIKTGSVAITKSTDNYQVGEIITFGENTKTKAPTTHRIIEEKNGKFITKGDANNSEDGQAVSGDEVIGRVVFSVPYVGYAVSAAQKPIGFLFIIIIPAIIIVYDEMLNIKKEVKKKMDYRKRAKKREENKENAENEEVIIKKVGEKDKKSS